MSSRNSDVDDDPKQTDNVECLQVHYIQISFKNNSNILPIPTGSCLNSDFL